MESLFQLMRTLNSSLEIGRPPRRHAIASTLNAPVLIPKQFSKPFSGFTRRKQFGKSARKHY
jgi:hypothetical protein